MKRKAAGALVAVVLAAAVGGFLVIRTPWAGRQVCAVVEERIRSSLGLELALGSCRFEPHRLEVVIGGIRIGPAAAPILTADAVRARVSALQLGGLRLDLAEVEVVRPRLTARIPPPRPDAPKAECPPQLLQRFGIRQLEVREGAVDLTMPRGERLRVARLDVGSTTAEQGRIAELAHVVTRRAHLVVSVAGATLEQGGRAVAIDGAHVDADVALDLSRADVTLATAEVGGVSLAATGRVEALCDPRFDLAASLEGEVGAVLALLGSAPGHVAGRLAVDASVTGTARRPAVDAGVRLSGVELAGWRPGDATLHLALADDALRFERVEVPALGGRVDARGVLRFGPTLGLEAEAALHNVELGEIFSRLKLPHAWVMARIDGTTRVRGTVAPFKLTGEAGLDLNGFRVLDHPWDQYRPGEPTILDAARTRLDANVTIDPAGVRIDSARIRAGEGALAARAMLHFGHANGFEITCDGTVDLGVLRHVATVPLSGLARIDAASVRAAPYGPPGVEGRVAVRGLRLLQLDLGDVAARLTYGDYVLDAAAVDGRRGATRYDGGLALVLSRPIRITGGHFRAHGRLRDLFEAAMPWQPGAVYFRDTVDGDVDVHATLAGPVGALQSGFDAELGAGTVAARPFDGGRVTGRVVDGASVAFDRVELRRAAGVARASGTIGFVAPHPWSLDGKFTEVALADLRLPGTTWAGALTGEATLRGSWEDPRGEANAEVTRLEIAQLVLGSGDAHARLADGAITATARAGGVSVDAAIQTSGDRRFEGKARLDVEDLLRLAATRPASGWKAAARGGATFAGRLADLDATRLELRLDQLRGGYGDLQVENAAPVVLVLEDGRAVVRSLTMRGPSTEFTVSGARDRGGLLGLDARGTLDLRLFAGIPAIVDPRGQIAVEAHVGGTATEPLLVGSGTLRDASFRVRDLPIAFAGIAGDVAFSQNRMLFDRLTASVNGGHAELDGELELVRLFPARIRVGAKLDEVPVRIPAYLPSVVSGRLQASGSWEAMLVSGKLHVVQALYTEPVDLEKRLVEVQRRRREPRPFDRASEGVVIDIALAVDGDVRVENDVARGALRGDLTLTGTLASPGVVGTLTMSPGGRATFRGNEFVLRHAVVDFTERRRVQMTLDAHGEAQVRDYQVFAHLYGPYEDPKLSLTTQPALSQQDIVTLLSLGYTTRDTAASGTVTGVATAAAAQALMTASGLDDQVRRFVPRGKLLRDFNVRITSAYSEGAGQVLPRAEFESKVLDDRLRLRYQAPLAGARGQRAQAEMRIGEHTSVQYQWDNDNPDVTSGGDHGVDLKLRWEWND